MQKRARSSGSRRLAAGDSGEGYMGAEPLLGVVDLLLSQNRPTAVRDYERHPIFGLFFRRRSQHPAISRSPEEVFQFTFRGGPAATRKDELPLSSDCQRCVESEPGVIILFRYEYRCKGECLSV